MREVIYKVFSQITFLFLLSINLLSIILSYKRDNYSHANTPLLYYESCAVPQSSDPPRLSQISGPFKARSSLSKLPSKKQTILQCSRRLLWIPRCMLLTYVPPVQKPSKSPMFPTYAFGTGGTCTQEFVFGSSISNPGPSLVLRK